MDGMDLLKATSQFEVLVMQAAREVAEKAIRKRDEDQAARIAHYIWKTMPKMK